MTINFVIQRVTKASLLIDNKEKYEDIKSGIIIYLSILKETTEDDIQEIIKKISIGSYYFDINNKYKPCSILDVECDVMIIPQASLAGKVIFY
jgi:D-Tyr-tRNAtyr deacylase